MSYDIFLQGFVNGGASENDCGPSARALISSATDRADPQHRFVHITVGESAADVYGVTAEGEPMTGLMFNRIKEPAEGVLDLIVALAQAADWAILPTGAATCPVSESQRDHLPPELAHGESTVVSSGRDLLCVIRGA